MGIFKGSSSESSVQPRFTSVQPKSMRDISSDPIPGCYR